jgi:cysteinyl-tRNA synthetase
METLIAQREQARAQKDWTRADVLRDKLKQLGFVVQDKKV